MKTTWTSRFRQCNHITVCEDNRSLNFFRFIRQYYRLVLFGFGLTFFSSFGQTFLVSLFVPDFQNQFGISNAYFGTIYSLATLTSAIALVWVGSKIDQVHLKKYALAITGGLILSTLLIASSQWIWMLFLGLFGVRLFGQGLCGHTANTTMARYFNAMRGKALSLANLGFSVGEAVLPITITAMLGVFGWRMGWTFISIFIFLFLPALIIAALGRNPLDHAEEGVREQKAGTMKEPGSQWRRRLVLRDRRFYLLLPSSFASPFLLTGFFLYQTQLATYKNWEIEILASAFVAFAFSKSVASIVSGPLIDRFKACRLFPFYLIPLFAGLLMLLVFSYPWIAFVYMFLAGVSMGISSNVTTSLYAELYGTANLGTIRSMMTMFILISTAVSPILFGFLLDTGFTFSIIIKGSMSFVFISAILAIFIYREAENTIS